MCCMRINDIIKKAVVVVHTAVHTERGSVTVRRVLDYTITAVWILVYMFLIVDYSLVFYVYMSGDLQLLSV